MAKIEEAMKKTFGAEGGYSDNPDDPGGPTKFGVTEKNAREIGYTGDMKDFPFDLAVKVYMKFWNKAWDYLKSQKVANELFDTKINAWNVGDMIGQAAINSLNLKGSLFPNMAVDGVAGLKTVNCMNILTDRGDEEILLKVMNGLQRGWYIACAAGDEAKGMYLKMLKQTSCPGNEKAETFMRGWIRHRT